MMTRSRYSFRLILLTLWTLLISLGLMLGLATPVQAHGSGFPFRFVARHGVDSSDCSDSQHPCRTILYALRQAIPGDQIRVAAGTYFFDNIEATLLLSELIPVKGGYNPADEFTVQNPQKNLTYLLGPNPVYQTELANRGFRLIKDAKAIETEETVNTATIQAQSIPTSFTSCRAGLAGIYPCQGLDLLAHIPLTGFSSTPNEANDIWGFVDLNDNNEYALIGLRNGTAVVNVTNPFQPIEVGTIPGLSATWRDIKVYQFYDHGAGRWKAYAYVTVDGANQGMHIIDLTALPNSISLAATYTGFQQAHNIYISHIDYTTGVTQSGSTAYAYILGSREKNGGQGFILDLSNPISPTQISGSFGTGYVHDATTFVITDSRTVACHMGHNPCELYIDFNENTLDIWDVTDKTSPQQISTTPYAGSAYTHSGWWSTDKMFIFIQDEIDERVFGHNTRLRTVDISDLTTPFVSRVWDGPTSAIDHNGFSNGTNYYMSNYRRGLTVLDIANPNNPSESAFFDTYPSNDNALYSGAWGTYPYLPGGTILISDIESGLFLVRKQSLLLSKTGPSMVELGQPITYTLTLSNVGELTATTIILTHTLPANSIHLSGGTQIGSVISWTFAALPPGQMTQTTFVISPTNAGTIGTTPYGLQAEDGLIANQIFTLPGDQVVTTLVTKSITYLPLIFKD